jgi:DNA-binding HxlR family transcriptional regulator
MRVTRTSQEEFATCPLYTAMGVIGGKWKPMLLYRIICGINRPGALNRSMAGVSPKVVRQQLRELECDGIVVRLVVSKQPPHVEFGLTPYGETLGPVLDALGTWGEGHVARRARNLA